MDPRAFLRRSADASARRTYDLVEEPAADDYRALIRAASLECAAGVVGLSAHMSAAARSVAEELGSHAAHQSAAPGSGSFVRFRLTPETVATLQGAADRLFAWVAPHLPDSLCFVRADGSPWLLSIAGRRLASMELTQLERLRLGRLSPSLASMLVHQAGRDALLVGFERRLEEHVDSLVADLVREATTAAARDDGRDALIEALEAWLLSDDDVRVAAALEVARRLRADELRDIAARLRHELESAEPAVVTPALGERWRGRRRRLLDAVLASLGEADARA